MVVPVVETSLTRHKEIARVLGEEEEDAEEECRPQKIGRFEGPNAEVLEKLQRFQEVSLCFLDSVFFSSIKG